MRPTGNGDDSTRSLRVGIVSTCAVSTPPRAYGGTELVVAELARGLVSLGHRPTVFATGDSTCPGAERCLFDLPVWPPNNLAELRHASAAWSQIATRGGFDIVHVHHAEALPFSQFVPLPTVTTIHHSREDRLVDHYASFPDIAFVAISARQAELSWEVPFHAVIHHGLDIEQYPSGEGGAQLAFLGRFARDKAPHVAIDAARRVGIPIVLGGEAHPAEYAYYESEVAPRLRDGDDARWLGEVGHQRKLELLSSSGCMLFPIQWEEPFGLVMIESMLVGTPVVAFACGAALEVIDEGITGFLVHDFEELCQRARDAMHLDRAACRAHARERWSRARMAREYAALYLDLVERWESARDIDLGAFGAVQGWPRRRLRI